MDSSDFCFIAICDGAFPYSRHSAVSTVNQAKKRAVIKAVGIDSLKGHRSVGVIRASIYNAFPTEGVKALVAFMKEVEKKNR